MIYNIIQSNSTGNCVIYDKKLMVDCGVPFSKIKDYMDDVKVILMTHEHGDHLNPTTVRKIVVNYPKIRWVAGQFMHEKLTKIGVENIEFPLSNRYNPIGCCLISSIKLYHDVKSFGYRIAIENNHIIHATDTAHLKGIEAKSYDYYMLECNHVEKLALDLIEKAKEEGKFCHYSQSINSHLSAEKAIEFFEENRGEKSKLVPLHISSGMEEDIYKLVEEANNDNSTKNQSI